MAAPRLLERYRSEVAPKLQKEFGYKNPHQVPKFTKIVVNIGLGEATQNPKLIERASEELAAITGQKALVRKSKKAIANFKLRAGLPIGCMVTLRGARMWEFFDRLVNVALPRVRDFRGTPTKGFDGRGNYTLGLREQIIFPEVEFDKVERIVGMNVTVCTTAPTDAEALALLTHLGMPFRRA
jgi:large subunit ribosomal protein L5